MSTDRVSELREILRANRPEAPDLAAPIRAAVDRQVSVLHANQEPTPGDHVVITDTSLNFGDMYGRAAVLKDVRDDEDGFNFRVRVTDLIGLTTYGGVYETWVTAIEPTDPGDEK